MTEETALREPQAGPAFAARITDEINVTPAARAKLAELLADAEEDIAGIRVFVGGGGCSGMQYGMTFADQLTPYDSVLEAEGFRMYVDAVALNYLQGAEVDFVERPVGASFVFRNVFAAVGGSGACGGCGSAGGGGGGCA
jgi:iron-sulfur cluster insertion protein